MKDESYKLHNQSEMGSITYYMDMKSDQENVVLGSLVQRFFHNICICIFSLFNDAYQ
jgi:hypothetical protein